MQRQFKRILDLVRRTGDRMVVTDPDGEEAYVIMGLDQYEDLLAIVEHHHDDFDDEDEDDDIDWKPEDYGDLVSTEAEQRAEKDERLEDDLPDDLREAVEHDLAILESWKKETEATVGVPEQKNSQTEQKNADDEERFYLEPIE